MKLKQGFLTRTIGDTKISFAADDSTFGGMVRSNETAAFVVDRLRRETTPESIIADMYAEGDASIGVVSADVERILNFLRGIGALDE
ncbi:MAG: PqqD family protein [Oscillibacter sp.]|nr:PqqD family protein [Oscillibacter sp.]